MSSKKNMELFKEHCNRSVDYEISQQQLLTALEQDKTNEKLTCLDFNNKVGKDGYINEDKAKILNDDQERKLFKLLFGSTAIDSIGKEHTGKKRDNCEGFFDDPKTGKDYEKRICKCLFYHNKDDVIKACNKCNKCKYNDYYKIVDSPFTISDYEDPSFYEGKGIGEVDLVIKYDNNLYATEVKPHNKENKGNDESILRMIAEILTYTYNNPKYKKAIAFFNNTPQHEEYKKLKDGCRLCNIMDIAKINVFLITDIDNDHKKFKIELIRNYE